MAKEGGDFTASWVLHIREAETGALHQALLLACPPLFWRGMKVISVRGMLL